MHKPLKIVEIASTVKTWDALTRVGLTSVACVAMGAAGMLFASPVQAASAPACDFHAASASTPSLAFVPLPVALTTDGTLSRCTGDASVSSGAFSLTSSGTSSIMSHSLSGTGTISWKNDANQTVGDSEVSWNVEAKIGNLSDSDSEGSMTVTSGQYNGTKFAIDVKGIDLDLGILAPLGDVKVPDLPVPVPALPLPSSPVPLPLSAEDESASAGLLPGIEAVGTIRPVS